MTSLTASNREKGHMAWIDILRVIAIVLVVLCHSTEEGIYDLSLGPILAMQQGMRIFPFACFTLGRIGVPIFLIITGYLLLGREYKREETSRFWKKNWFHLILCTMFWFLIYDLFLVFSQGKKMLPGEIIQDILFLFKVDMSHVWYMPMIIGIYALIPFAAIALNKSDNQKTLWIPIAFFFIALFVYPTVSVVFRSIDPNMRIMSNQLGTGFSGGSYGIYLFMGWLIKKRTFRRIKWYLLAILSCVSIAGAIWIQLWSYSNGIQYNIWYDSPFLLLAAVSIFELFSRWNISDKHGIIKWLASYAFGIYLVHFPFKLLLLESIKRMDCKKEFQVFTMWGLLIFLGLIVSIIIGFIPKLGNYLLYRRKETSHEKSGN